MIKILLHKVQIFFIFAKHEEKIDFVQPVSLMLISFGNKIILPTINKHQYFIYGDIKSHRIK